MSFIAWLTLFQFFIRNIKCFSPLYFSLFNNRLLLLNGFESSSPLNAILPEDPIFIFIFKTYILHLYIQQAIMFYKFIPFPDFLSATIGGFIKKFPICSLFLDIHVYNFSFSSLSYKRNYFSYIWHGILKT